MNARDDSMPRDTAQPRMYQDSSTQLVNHLTHANGWWRDMAQQVLVMRQDKSVVPALKALARGTRSATSSSGNAESAMLGRFHALWTLEGLGAADAALVREVMRDANPRMRVQALRVSESLYKGGDKTFADDYKRMANDAEADVAAHAVLTLNVLKVPEATATIRQVAALNKAAGVLHVANRVLNAPPDTGAGGNSTVNRTAGEMALLGKGLTTFKEMCGECHGPTGLGTPAGEGQLIAPALAGNPRVTTHPERVIKTLLHGDWADRGQVVRGWHHGAQQRAARRVDRVGRVVRSHESHQ